MNIIKINNGVELFRLMNELKANGTKKFKGKEVIASAKANEEYNKICKGLEQYGKSLVMETLPREKQLIADANYMINDISQSSERDVLDIAINKVKQTGKPVEFNYRTIKYIAEINNGAIRVRTIK